MQVLNIFHVLVAIAMVVFILVQRGPGATAGAAFGSGASGTVFGSRGAGSFLSRATWVLATLFCLISLTMAVVVSRDLSAPQTDLGIMGGAVGQEQPLDVAPGLQSADDESLLDDVPPVDLGTDAPGADDLPVIDDSTLDESTGDDLPEINESGEESGDDSGGTP